MSLEPPEPAVDSGDSTHHRAAARYVATARRDIVRGSLWTVAATGIGLPVALLANVLVARSLGPHGLGRFATYTAVFGIIAPITNLGWSEATSQWLASATARGEETERTELIRRSSGFHVFVSGPACGCCALVLLLGSDARLAIIGAIAVYATQCLGTSMVVNTATARNARAAQISIIAGLTGQTGLVLAAVTSRRPDTAWAAQLGLLFVAPLLSTLSLTRDERAAVLSPRLVLRMPNGFRTYAASACIGGLVASLVYGRSEIIVLRANGLLQAAGVFAVITGLAGQMTSLLDSTQAPLTPIAAGLVAVDRARAVRVFQRSLRVASVLCAFAACALPPIGVIAITLLYGSAFRSAPAPFAFLALVSTLQTALGPMSAFAYATRSAANVLRINLVSLAVDAAIALSLIPVVGLWGAVLANGVAQVVGLLWIARLVGRRLELPLATVVAPLRIYGCAMALGAVEVVAALRVHGAADVAVVPVVLGGLLTLRGLLHRFPSLGLTPSDLAIIGVETAGSRLSRILAALRWAGAVPREREHPI